MNADKTRSKSPYDPLYLQARDAEVHQEGNAHVCRAEVIHALGVVDLVQAVQCLDLDDDGVLDEQIRHVFTDDFFAITYMSCPLLFEREMRRSQLDGQRILVDLFEKSCSKCVRNTICTRDDLRAQTVQIHLLCGVH